MTYESYLPFDQATGVSVGVAPIIVETVETKDDYDDDDDNDNDDDDEDNQLIVRSNSSNLMS